MSHPSSSPGTKNDLDLKFFAGLSTYIEVRVIGVLINVHVRHFMARVRPQGAMPRLARP